MIAAENEKLSRSRIDEVSSMLSPEYQAKGFKLSQLFGRAIVLSHNNELIFVFSTKIEITPETLSRLCEHHLANCKNK